MNLALLQNRRKSSTWPFLDFRCHDGASTHPSLYGTVALLQQQLVNRGSFVPLLHPASLILRHHSSQSVEGFSSLPGPGEAGTRSRSQSSILHCKHRAIVPTRRKGHRLTSCAKSKTRRRPFQPHCVERSSENWIERSRSAFSANSELGHIIIETTLINVQNRAERTLKQRSGENISRRPSTGS